MWVFTCFARAPSLELSHFHNWTILPNCGISYSLIWMGRLLFYCCPKLFISLVNYSSLVNYISLVNYRKVLLSKSVTHRIAFLFLFFFRGSLQVPSLTHKEVAINGGLPKAPWFLRGTRNFKKNLNIFGQKITLCHRRLWVFIIFFFCSSLTYPYTQTFRTSQQLKTSSLILEDNVKNPVYVYYSKFKFVWYVPVLCNSAESYWLYLPV